MNRKDDYEELALYLSQAEKEISNAFRDRDDLAAAGTRTSDETVRRNDQRVHFSDTISPATYDKTTVDGGHQQHTLKSCLKNSKGVSNNNNNNDDDDDDDDDLMTMTRMLNGWQAVNDNAFATGRNDFPAHHRRHHTSSSSYLDHCSPSAAASECDFYRRSQFSRRHQQLNNDNAKVPIGSDSEDNLHEIIETIKADIDELKEKYNHDDDATMQQRHRFPTQELDELLGTSSSPRETDILSDDVSSCSYHSAISEAASVRNANTQTSPPLSTNSNLSIGSECSSSPCLTSISDNDDDYGDDQSVRSSECKYRSPIDWYSHTHKISSRARVQLRGKSSSAPVLENKQLKVNKQARSQSDRHLAEIEAADACKWLRATGFPQYAQMYEEMQFPVDIATAALDHPRLDDDILNSLFRRLQILNDCVHLRQQKIAYNTDESEDENYALSRNWTFRSDIRRWSRSCIEPNSDNEANKSCWRETDEPFEQHQSCCHSSKERVRRGGSVKFRRRREGVVISDSGAKLLDSLSEQLSEISVTPNSDSELTPKFYNRLWRKSATAAAATATTTDGETKKCSSSIVGNNSRRSSRPQTSSKDDHDHDAAVDSDLVYCKFSSQQLGQLERIAMLKLTAYIEKYCPTHRTGWNWDVPKSLIRKMKSPAYKDKTVFGVPIQLTLQRTGLPLPRNIEWALEWLSENAADQVGLFRKSGVKSRIQALRNVVENSSDLVSFEDQQSYDVADMVKQYFRELPEALLTHKLSETFKLIFQFVPGEFRLDAVLCAIFLMPDEHIEVLQALLGFLTSIAEHSDENQMNASNLAMCFAPSLFHYSPISKSTYGTPHPKDLAENQAAQDCIQFFLENYERLFTIPRALLNQCNPAEMEEWKVLPLSELGREMGGWREYLRECEQAHLREVKDRSRGWTTLSSISTAAKVEIYQKKIDDGLSVRVWKCIADIDAPPTEVLHRILRERHLWDMELISARIVVQLDKNAEIFQYGRKRMTARLPTEEYSVVRQWNCEYPRGSCSIVETSIDHEDVVHVPNATRGIVHASRYFIEPCGSGRSRMYNVCRIDTMGRKPDYYYKNFGHVLAFFVANIQQSFHQQTTGPESKV